MTSPCFDHRALTVRITSPFPPSPSPSPPSSGDKAVVVTNCGVDTAPSNLVGAIIAVFVVAAISATGFLLPRVTAGSTHPALRAAFAACQFGATAVLLTVGFVHILGDASDHLSSPCLPASFTEAFPGWAELVTSATVMGMMMIDHFTLLAVEAMAAADTKCGQTDALTCTDPDHAVVVLPKPVELDRTSAAVVEVIGHGACHPVPTGGSLAYRRAVVALVEASVCTHSVPVGLALGVQSGDGFISLAIAISIHQLLEGFGVGAAVVDARYSRKWAALYTAGFTLTAPLGIALGAGLRSAINPNSAAYLYTVGFVNAIAAGMLIYVALRHMNAFDTQAAYLREASWRVSLLCFASFIVFGVASMLVGKWA